MRAKRAESSAEIQPGARHASGTLEQRLDDNRGDFSARSANNVPVFGRTRLWQDSRFRPDGGNDSSRPE